MHVFAKDNSSKPHHIASASKQQRSALSLEMTDDILSELPSALNAPPMTGAQAYHQLAVSMDSPARSRLPSSLPSPLNTPLSMDLTNTLGQDLQGLLGSASRNQNQAPSFNFGASNSQDFTRNITGLVPGLSTLVEEDEEEDLGFIPPPPPPLASSPSAFQAPSPAVSDAGSFGFAPTPASLGPVRGRMSAPLDPTQTLTPSQGFVGLPRQTQPPASSTSVGPREVIDCSPLSLPDPDPPAEETPGDVNKVKTPTTTLTPHQPLIIKQAPAPAQVFEPYLSPVSPFVLNELKISPAAPSSAIKAPAGVGAAVVHQGSGSVPEDTDEGMKQKWGFTPGAEDTLDARSHARMMMGDATYNNVYGQATHTTLGGLDPLIQEQHEGGGGGGGRSAVHLALVTMQMNQLPLSPLSPLISLAPSPQQLEGAEGSSEKVGAVGEFTPISPLDENEGGRNYGFEFDFKLGSLSPLPAPSSARPPSSRRLSNAEGEGEEREEGLVPPSPSPIPLPSPAPLPSPTPSPAPAPLPTAGGMANHGGLGVVAGGMMTRRRKSSIAGQVRDFIPSTPISPPRDERASFI